MESAGQEFCTRTAADFFAIMDDDVFVPQGTDVSVVGAVIAERDRALIVPRGATAEMRVQHARLVEYAEGAADELIDLVEGLALDAVDGDNVLVAFRSHMSNATAVL